VEVIVRLKRIVLHMDAKTAGYRPEEVTKLYVKHISSTAGICRNTAITQKVGD
jgi:hypothetical protein